ncbi:MAG: YggU family protein [Oxalobacter sp.]|nr:MAG: YggU family protein [Oxalobacter sp.]
MSRPWCSATANGLRVAVQISPNAKRTEVVGETDDALKIKLQAPPVDGKANEMLIRFLADVFNVPKSAITITHGHTSKKKLVEIRAANLSVESAMQQLTPQA